MPRTSDSTTTDWFVLLQRWQEAAQTVVRHIGGTRGLPSAYHQEEVSPWPLEAAELLQRDTPIVIDYFRNRHTPAISVPLERLAKAAVHWSAKRDAILAFGKTKSIDGNAAKTAALELARFSEEGLPEQRRLELDLRIAEGAVWRATFPLLAERRTTGRSFLIRQHLIHWALWVRDAFVEVVRAWPLPNESEILSRQINSEEKSAASLESHERWELAHVINRPYENNTSELPNKLAIEEARRSGDLEVVLPRIDKLMESLHGFVMQAIKWPQGNMWPSLADDLNCAVMALEELTPATQITEVTETQPAWPPVGQRVRERIMNTPTGGFYGADIAGEQGRHAAQSPDLSDSLNRGAVTPALEPIHWDILRLIRTLCYKGLPQTRRALVDPNNQWIPKWEPNPHGARLVLHEGVPEPLIRECVCKVPLEDAKQRWGEGGSPYDSALQYLLDRRLMDVFWDDVPIVAAFKNYFNDAEILATIRIEEGINGRSYVWGISDSKWHVLEEQDGGLVGRPYLVFKLTEHAHRLLENEIIGADRANPTNGKRTDESTTVVPPDMPIPLRALKAGEQYRQAVEALGQTDPTDLEVYDKLAAALGQSGESKDLPCFATWQRNLRLYRNHTGQQKNKPRAGRKGNSGSMIRADQITPDQLPTRVRPEHLDQ
jgi:hypothetical protein